MKILVIRFSSIGDIILTTPVLRWLGQLDAEVHYLTKSSFTDLISNNPAVHKVHALQDNISETIKTLKTENFDLIIDLHKNVRSKKVRKSLGCKYLSYNKLNIKKWLFVNFKINLLPDIHILDRYAKALESLKLNTENRSIDYHFPADFSFNLEAIGLQASTYTCIVIGGTYFTKQIPASKILSLIKHLNRPTVLLGAGDNDKTKAEQLQGKLPENVINLVNKLSLIESAYVIKQSAEIITSDTGLMHIASAFDIPIHTLWGNTHPRFGMYAYRTNTQNVHNYILDIPCQPCSKLGSDGCPRGHFDCMLKQNVEQIVKNCESNDTTQ